MSLHDAYARLTPFELLFSDPAEAEALWSRVSEESAGRGADVHDPHAFVTMGTVTDFIRRVEGDDAPDEAILQYGSLAFHALHLARAGLHVHLLTAGAARYLVEGAPDGEPIPPASAGYLQLPRHLFWLDDGAGVPQSVDGVFWKVTARDEGEVLHALLATALRPDRTGLGVVPLPQAPLADAPGWLDADARGDGGDFSTTMPGAELDGLYAFATAGEVLKLLARFFAHVASRPDAREPGEPHEAPAAPATEGDGPEPSALPYLRVNL